MEELVREICAARDGDLSAYGRIVRKFQDMAYGCAYARLGDFHLAEDAAQEAFVVAYRKLPDLREPRAFPGWFRRVVLTQCNQLRRKKQLPTVPLDEAATVRAASDAPDVEVEKMEMKDKVLDAIQSLPEGQRMATTLFYINGYSQNEVADFLEVPVSTVKKRLHDSRRKLKERMIEMVADELKSHPLSPRFADVVTQMNLVTGRINPLGEGFRKLTEDQMRAKTDELRKRLAAGEPRESVRSEAFALVRESTARTIGQRHYDIQLVAGMMLDEGWIAEESAGEGKTITCLPAAYMAAIEGKHVDIVTVNEYLAQRDAGFARKVLGPLGVSVEAVTHRGRSDDERARAYRADITYGDVFQLFTDYVGSLGKSSASARRLDVAIIDEIDSVLIDNGATSVSVPTDTPLPDDEYREADKMALELMRRHDERPAHHPPLFGVTPRHACEVSLTEEGRSACEPLAADRGKTEEMIAAAYHRVCQALRAHLLYERDREYVVRDGRIVILDKETGRPQLRRRWSEGLHEAIECREGIEIRPQSMTLSNMRIGDYFRLYRKLAGLSGSADPQAEEFEALYGLKVATVPTRRPRNRIDYDDRLYRDSESRLEGLVAEVKHHCRELRRPVLIGVATIEESEQIANRLRSQLDMEPQLLNARPEQAARESEIVGNAGCLRASRDRAGSEGVVTVATPMAGRGTDVRVSQDAFCPDCIVPEESELRRHGIRAQSDFPAGTVKCCLCCDEYAPKTSCSHCFKPKRSAEFPTKGRTQCQREVPCGLHVIGVGHTSRRADAQLRSRASRQGEPGSSRFLVSMDDPLLQQHAELVDLHPDGGKAITGAHVTKTMDRVQEQAEHRDSRIRIACAQLSRPGTA